MKKIIQTACTLAVFFILYSCTFSQKRPDTRSAQPLFAAEVDNESEDDISIVSSPDGTISLYSRNSHSRDASFGWSILYDVRDMDSVYTYEGLPDWEGEVASISNIYSLPHPKRHLYLFDANVRISGAYSYNAFIAYERIGHELKRVPVIRDLQGNMVNETGFEYNHGDYYFRFARALTYDYMYLWDESKAVLYYPVLNEDSYYLSDLFEVWRWNGNILYPTTDTVCNPRLYEPLRNYVTCLQHTKGYIQARVDSLKDGRLRYTAWERDNDISTSPDIILYGRRKGKVFHFHNPPTYTYVVSTDNVPEVHVYYSQKQGELGELNDVYKED